MTPLLFRLLIANLVMNLLDIVAEIRQLRRIQNMQEEPIEVRLKNKGIGNKIFDGIRVKEIGEMKKSLCEKLIRMFYQTSKIYLNIPSLMWSFITRHTKEHIYKQPATYIACDLFVIDVLSLPIKFLDDNENSGSIELLICVTALELVVNYILNWSLAYIWLIGRSKMGRDFHLLDFILLVTLAPLLILVTTLQYNRAAPSKSLTKKLKKLADDTCFPFSDIYCVKKEESLAYYVGLIKIHAIVISTDTLKKIMTDDEIVAIAAHEIGHWNHGHTWYNIITIAIYSFGLRWFLTDFYETPILFDEFNLNIYNYAMIIIIINNLVTPPIDMVFKIIFHLESRHCEFQADSFAKDQGQAANLKSSLIKLYREEKLFPADDKLYLICNKTHPSISERIQAINS